MNTRNRLKPASDDGRCMGHNKRTKKRCGIQVSAGARYCKYHGGGSANEQVNTLIRQRTIMGLTISDIDGIDAETPAEAMTRMIRVSSHLEQVLGYYVEKLILEKANPQQVAAHQMMHSQERDRLMRYCDVAIRAGIAEQVIEMAKSDGRRLVEITLGVLQSEELGLTAVQQTVARQLLAARMREMADDAG